MGGRDVGQRHQHHAGIDAFQRANERRNRESDDDELTFAYYCANVPSEREAVTPYDRKKFSKASSQASMTIYHRKHIQKLVQMVVKAIGADPHGWMANLMGAFIWRRLQSKAA